MIITQEEKIISQKLSILTSVVSVLKKPAMLFKIIIIGGGNIFLQKIYEVFKFWTVSLYSTCVNWSALVYGCFYMTPIRANILNISA